MERGTDATGCSYVKGGRISVRKAPIPANKFRFVVPFGVSSVMGHTRHATQGKARHNCNNHPFWGKTLNDTHFAFAHNGVLWNDQTLKQEYHLPKSQIKTDSYVAVQLLEQQKNLNFGSLKLVAEKVSGSFSFTVLDDRSNLFIIKGDSPFVLLHFKRLKIYVYASTPDILANAIIRTPLIKEINELTPQNHIVELIKPLEGDILCIDRHGGLTKDSFEFSSFDGYNWYDLHYAAFDNEENDWYTEQLLQAAENMGFSTDDVFLLLDYGFDESDVEEMIYDYGEFKATVEAVKKEFG